ncbi:MAG: Bax inhibitor-1/YccA family protein [Polyangiaceae bacterium]
MVGPQIPSYAGSPPNALPSSKLAYLRKVYALFTGGIFFAIAGALVALYGGGTETVDLRGGGTLELSPILAFTMNHWIVSMVVYLGAFFVASFARRIRGLSLLALFGYTFVTGVFIAPSLFIATLMASQGGTVTAAPVRDAFVLTGLAFSGLTAFVMFTKKDFSYLGATLSMGLWVVLGASLLSIFFQSAVFSLAIASVGVLLFGGYILYDTSAILRDEEDDAVGAALRLFLDVINLFLMLLRILSARRN